MNVGILGGGNISDTHARAAVSIPGVRIAAICGTNREKSAALARRVGGTVYEDLDGFLDHRPMDLVAIGSPSGMHAEQAVAAARRGLHVLIEKPVDITTTRVDALIAEAERAGITAGVFFQDRLKPDVLRMKSLVDDGRLGRPVLAAGRVRWYRPHEYYRDSRWRGTWALDGGGALMNQGIHTVDLLLWLFGPIVQVSAFVATRVHSIEVEDTVTAVLEFESGALGAIEAGTSLFPGYPRRIELTGSDGTVVLEQDRLVRTDLRGAPADRAAGLDAPATGGEQTHTVGDALAHQRVFENFIGAIETNGSPACDAREGRKSVAAVEAIYRSARERRVVTL